MKYILNLIRFIKFQIKRLKYLKDSPHEIALGFACGVWTNFNPFFGINIFIGMGLAFVCALCDVHSRATCVCLYEKYKVDH